MIHDNNTPTRAGAGAASSLHIEFSELKKRLREQGAFDADPRLCIRQSLQAAAFLACFFALASIGGWICSMLASACLGLFQCLMAYVSHDVAHGQATRSPKAMKALMPILSLAQGLSLQWWRRKHGHHHAHTNEISRGQSGPIAVDEDIDTMPLFCWSPKLLGDKHLSSPIWRGWLRVQRYAIWPFFPILRLQWIYHGLRQGTWAEAGLICAHHALLIGAASLACPGGLLTAVALVLGANAVSGSILCSFFLFGHSGMLVREHGDGLGEFQAQARTTCNFSENAFVTWLSGGLNRQIEHHLFPTMPRSRLPMATPLARELAHRHGEPHRCEGILASYARVFASLDMGELPDRANKA